MSQMSTAMAKINSIVVITTGGPALEEHFLDGDNVFLCPPEDPAAMAAAMQKVMDDAEFRGCLQRGAIRFSDEWFSWNSATRRTKAALESAL